MLDPLTEAIYRTAFAWLLVVMSYYAGRNSRLNNPCERVVAVTGLLLSLAITVDLVLVWMIYQ